MKRHIKLFLVMTILLAMVACATTQAKWNALTPDEKARIVIGDIQGQLDNAFNTGKTYITANPKYQDKWQKEIIPAMDVANKALAGVITLSRTKPLTPDVVYATVQAQVNNVLALLIQIGAIKP